MKQRSFPGGVTYHIRIMCSNGHVKACRKTARRDGMIEFASGELSECAECGGEVTGYETWTVDGERQLGAVSIDRGGRR